MLREASSIGKGSEYLFDRGIAFTERGIYSCIMGVKRGIIILCMDAGDVGSSFATYCL